MRTNRNNKTVSDTFRCQTPNSREPLTDFSIDEQRERFQEALDKVQASLPRKVPILVGSKPRFSSRTLERENPSHLSQIVAYISLSEISDAERALQEAQASFPAWSRLPVPARCKVFQRAADGMRKRRLELAALQVIEVGKPWAEADADVAEAIDFLTYYPHALEHLETELRPDPVPGEENLYRREPLGPGGVIAPWNFPLAILTGMSSAALVTGNSVVLKPAEQSSLTGWALVEILLEAGVPPGVVQFLPGIGEEVGPALVRSSKTHWIAFTGSKAVGLEIIRAAAEVPPDQMHLKRVIAEMGGKNGIIVDEDADLDEAVVGVAISAFGYAGQKCSACSRVIVLDSLFDRFVRRLTETTRSLPIGPAEAPGTVVGPLVDASARQKALAAIERGKKEATLVLECAVPAGLDGHFVGPAIFQDADPKSWLAQEEIFGPVLVMLRAESFEEAIGLANAVPYALTGGLYSRSPSHIEQAKRTFEVGNLYINRKITGAVVGRQPFGGFKLSGTGYPAGGPDYLLQFLKGRTLSENVTRHGFAP